MTLTLALLGCCMAGEPAAPSTEKFSPAGADAATRIQEAVLRELASSGMKHPWAGMYRRGGKSLSLAPIAGFAFESGGCSMGDRNIGYVVDEGDRLRLTPTYENDAGMPVEWMKVTWGAQRYLVGVDELQTFCNAVNLGESPDVLSRDGGGETRGRPQTADGPLDCVLERPIRTRIVSVVDVQVSASDDENETIATTVKLGAGRAQGVRAGMAFRLQASGAFEGQDLTVVQVDEDGSVAMIEIEGEKGISKVPRAGWPVSTRAR